MKKLIIAFACLLCVLNSNAQVRLGGSILIDAKKMKGAEVSEGNSSLKLEGGYALNEKWEIALGIGFTSRTNENGIKDFGNRSDFFLNPYVRYTFAKVDALGFYVDAAFQETLNTTKNQDAQPDFWVGLRLGLKYQLSDKFVLVSQLGQWGFREVKDAYSQVGLDLSNGLSFGLYYSF